MQPRADHGHLASLGKWIAELRYDAIPEDALRAARYQLLNMIAAAYAAHRLPDTRAVARAIGRFGGEGTSTVLCTTQRAAPAEAAQVNAAYSIAQDFDDIVWMGHTGHSAVFASLAVAEHEGADLRALLTAIVAANEVGGRLGASSFLGPLNGQMWTFIHLIGAAAATAKLLELDAARATHALAIALSQPNFALQPAFLAPSSKLLSASTPTATGIHAAYFAREGITGAPGLLEDRRGFWRRFSYQPMPYMLGELGDFWTTQTLAIKTYPGCHYFQTACTALEEIMERLGPIEPDAIESVHVATTKLGAEATRFGREYGGALGESISHVNVNFDLATTAAVLLHAGRLTSREVEPEHLDGNARAILALRARIEVEHDPELSLEVLRAARALPTGRRAIAELTARELWHLRKVYGAEYGSSLLSAREGWQWIKAVLRGGRSGARTTGSSVPLSFPNRVTVRLRDGRVETNRVDLPVGSFCLPSMETELRQKFVREVGAVIGEPIADDAFARALELDAGAWRPWLRSLQLDVR